MSRAAGTGSGQPPGFAPDLHSRPVELLRGLLGFDTTNPPGGERACIEWVEGLLREAGLETTIVAREPERPNLIARLPGAGSAPPLLLQGHVDVVPTAGQSWSRPPFGAALEDGYVWGRGALDMKGGVAMFLAAVMRARALGLEPAGEVIVAVLADEEAGGGLGAKAVVEDRPELFDGVRYALGEFGAFTIEIAGRRFYPIQVAEKQLCSVRATVRGAGGHGSLPARGGTTARLAELLRALDRERLPVHVTEPTRLMAEGIAAELGLPVGRLLRLLLVPALTDRILDLLGERGRFFDPLLHNTANPTILRAGEKINVVPAEATAELDGRLLPGFGPEAMLAELGELLGDEVELEVTRFEQGPASTDMGLFDLLSETLREADPEARPVPLLLPGVTDGRHFARLGIQGYGFLPMQLPEQMSFTELIHSADERVPAEAIGFGADTVYRVLERYGR